MSKGKEQKKAPAKVQKVLHPLSRKAKKITIDNVRDIKKDLNKSQKDKENNKLKKKILFFKDKITQTPNKKNFSLIEISQMIDEYLIGAKPNASGTAGDLLKNSYENDVKAFKTGDGYLCPDLTTNSNVKYIAEWDGDNKYLTQIQMKKFKYIENTDSKMD
ncbi:hypothetical protein DICPUDRAFT_41438 [Dictyostelium purpureum]|uniref:Translation machinery-associated protein 16 n=1 Tax=Dictyostelium purpureum TaxID=5786 RepID=F1A046_DICPU|nr:uncharacterized protein DICPUDRAFT_41438 [Dictyostelium purpureum]EGC30435.1 hypothetical protein DICPUDRAFT_41438 [Dictyostelium purpureum]|eukprot:XP_003293035.1 hypothetical protein DICPUDRAFT_41438 [Dictyostelium purpureum]